MLNLANELINEGLAKAKEFFLATGRIPENLFNTLVGFDPTPQKKYIEWMCKEFASNSHTQASIGLFSAVTEFDKLVQKKIIKGKEADINTYSDLEKVADKVNQNVDMKTKGEKKREEKIEGSEIVFENDKCKVYHVLSKNASCIYGQGTRWCTAASSSSNYFNSYHYDSGVNLYYIIPKGEFLESIGKHAVAVHPDGRKTVYNAQDNNVTSSFHSVCVKLGLDWD